MILGPVNRQGWGMVPIAASPMHVSPAQFVNCPCTNYTSTDWNWAFTNLPLRRPPQKPHFPGVLKIGFGPSGKCAFVKGCLRLEIYFTS